MMTSRPGGTGSAVRPFTVAAWPAPGGRRAEILFRPTLTRHEVFALGCEEDCPISERVRSGPTPSAGAALYVTHSTGVARFALAGGSLLPRLEIPAGETIGAIDGLPADGNTLIGKIESPDTVKPPVVLSIELDPRS